MKDLSKNSVSTPRLVLRKTVGTIRPMVAQEMPSNSVMRRNIRRWKAREGVPREPNSISGIEIDETLWTTKKNENFVIYQDPKERGDERLFIFGTTKNLEVWN